jgi:hypothetical protein
MFIYMKFGPDRHHWVYHWRGDLLRRQGEHHRYWKTIDDHAQDRADEVWKEMVRRRAETR